MDRRKAIRNLGVASLAVGATPLVSGMTYATEDKENQFLLDKNELKGKVAIVTGARNNLGRGFAVAFGKAGANVVVHYHTSKTKDQAEQTAKMVEEGGGKAIIVSGDLGKVSNVKKMFDAAINEWGRVDILVNNAGKIIKKPIAEVTEEEFDSLSNINSRGTFFCMREAAKRLSDNGRVINIGTSLFGAVTPNYAAYSGTKAGMEEYGRALAREVGSKGITVNTVCPGPVNTPFFHSQENEHSVAYVSKLSVAGRLGEVSDIVPLVAFLASQKSQWLSAQTFWINGGYLTR